MLETNELFVNNTVMASLIIVGTNYQSVVVLNPFHWKIATAHFKVHFWSMPSLFYTAKVI